MEQLLKALHLDAKRKGQGLDMVFCIRHGNNDIEFHMHNLLLEIASIDRDENPMRFDDRLGDFEYFVSKTNRIVAGKLQVLLELVSKEDFDKAKESIAKLGNQFSRIRIWQFDGPGKPPSGK